MVLELPENKDQIQIGDIIWFGPVEEFPDYISGFYLVVGWYNHHGVGTYPVIDRKFFNGWNPKENYFNPADQEVTKALLIKS